MQGLVDRSSQLFELGVSGDKISELQLYIDRLMTANEELNLVSRKMSVDELIDNHVLDCFLALPFFPKQVRRVADLGTGGGLPAILYAIVFPEIQFLLYEKSPRKQNFLNSLRDRVPNIEVRGEVPQDFTEVDLVIARGFKPIDVIVEMTKVYCKRGGAYFLLKGRREKVEEEIALAHKKNKEIDVKILKLVSPVMDVQRHLVLF